MSTEKETLTARQTPLTLLLKSLDKSILPLDEEEVSFCCPAGHVAVRMETEFAEGRRSQNGSGTRELFWCYKTSIIGDLHSAFRIRTLNKYIADKLCKKKVSLVFLSLLIL